jgi:hypothetical protein
VGFGCKFRSDSSDDDDVKSSKKGLARIAIKEAPSLFDTPYCLMAKGELKLCESDDFTYDDPVKMVSEGPDKATRGGGGEWEPIKFSRGNSAYVPNQSQHTSLLTHSRPHSYWEATSPRNRVRNLK